MELVDHIGIFRNLVSEEDCQEYIEFFEKVKNSEIGHRFTNGDRSGEASVIFETGKEQFKEGIYGRSDESVFIDKVDGILTEKCYNYLQQCYDPYSLEYPELKNMPLMTFDVKMQKTSPGGGYHVWHCESGSMSSLQRVMVWMIYLNDLPEGEGETEFFSQRIRVRPERGTVLIWPAGYTHAHRGNLVHTTDKYILTGWFVMVEGK